MPPNRAALAQHDLAQRVVLCPLSPPHLVAGVDISYSANSDVGYAAVVVMRLPKLKIVEIQTAQGVIDYPYSPGFLAFREGPLSASVIRKLECQPDVIMFDGSGVAHPRRLGMASHLGILFDIPTIGCAKTSLVVTPEDPGPKRGDFTPLLLDNEVVGASLRTRPGVKPVFVSPGHRADLPSALDLVLATTTHYRLPEPIRYAHRHANILRAASAHSGVSPSDRE